MRRIISVLLLAALTLPVTPALAFGPPEGPVYIALGDSQAFGVGTPREDKLGYVAVLHKWLHAVDCRDDSPSACPGLELENLSIPGATSSTLIANQLQRAVDLILERNSDTDPDNDVVLITVTIGGNDLFNPVVGACAGGPSLACAQIINEVFTTFAANLGTILGTLRAVAPDAQIVISTYENPVGACHLAHLEPLGDIVLEGGSLGGVTLEPGFNDLIRLIAGATGTDVADMFGEMTVDDWVGGNDCIHPDISGYHRMAGVFLDEISDLS